MDISPSKDSNRGSSRCRKLAPSARPNPRWYISYGLTIGNVLKTLLWVYPLVITNDFALSNVKDTLQLCDITGGVLRWLGHSSLK